MPYQIDPAQVENGKISFPVEIRLWPHQSLSAKGFTAFFGLFAALMTLPLLLVLGSVIWWFFLAPSLLLLWGVWHAIRKNIKDRQILEHLELNETALRLTRHNPGGEIHEFLANPYWVHPHLYPTSGPVEAYFTLSSQDKEVEVGAFLEAKERIALHGVIAMLLSELRTRSN